MKYDQGDTPKKLADEYVLGLMQGASRRKFERLQREHRVFRKAREQAEKRWNALSTLLPPEKPSAETWDKIQKRINPVSETPKNQSRSGLNLWRGWAIFASLLLAVVLISPQTYQTPQPGYVVVITHDDDATAGWLVSLEENMQQVNVESLSALQLPDERVFQLWVKASDQEKVKSVGLISTSGKVKIEADTNLKAALSKAVLFGVSVEPLGGSPTGQPTTIPRFHGNPRPI